MENIFLCLLLTEHCNNKFFAVQDGEQCFISSESEDSYKTYGSSTECLSDGEGGPLANDVYQIKN